MTTDDNDAKKQLAKVKQEMAKKKSKMTVPTEFLDNARSYDDKLVLVKYLTEKERGRVSLIIKKMIAQGMDETKKKRGLK